MISIFTTVTNPGKRGDPSGDALTCYRKLADEVIVVDGANKREHQVLNMKFIHHEWPQEFSWPFIGEQFTRGYQACTGDWVIHADVDFLFHNKDFGKIRQALKDYPTAPAVSFYKWQFILPDRYNLKSRLMIAVNKKKFGDRITFTGGRDLCQPQLDGQDLRMEDMPQAGVAFYNYEKLTKTKEQVLDDVGRMDRAYFRHFGKYLYSQDGTDESAFKGWFQMVSGRFRKPQRHIKLEEHPAYIQKTIKNLTPEQFGFAGFGELGANDYAENSLRG